MSESENKSNSSKSAFLVLILLILAMVGGYLSRNALFTIFEQGDADGVRYTSNTVINGQRELSDDDVKSLIVKHNFYCNKYSRTEKWCNESGDFKNDFSLKEEFDEKIQFIETNDPLKRLAEGLRKPVWFFNKEKAAWFIESEMDIGNIYAVVVREADGKTVFCARERNDKWATVKSEGNISGKFLIKKENIVHDENIIGVVEVYFTTATYSALKIAVFDAVLKQLAEELRKPVWFFDEEKAVRLIESKMRLRDVYAVVVKEADGKTVFCAIERNDKWGTVKSEGNISGKFLIKKKNIVYDKNTIGVVEVCFTTTVKDAATGLMWDKAGSDNRMTFKGAQAYIESLNSKKFEGYNDWRLPTLEELASLLENKMVNDIYIDPVFKCNKEFYWTTAKRASGGVWLVDFGGGCVGWGYAEGICYVRAVRSRTMQAI
ncbi:MAG: DUF1566 domain-containing protein [Desulfobacteraceae bacterium]|nr:DUF1566 domain-containing protein [Desulfobacteraceae bacterium]